MYECSFLREVGEGPGILLEQMQTGKKKREKKEIAVTFAPGQICLSNVGQQTQKGSMAPKQTEPPSVCNHTAVSLDTMFASLLRNKEASLCETASNSANARIHGKRQSCSHMKFDFAWNRFASPSKQSLLYQIGKYDPAPISIILYNHRMGGEGEEICAPPPPIWVMGCAFPFFIGYIECKTQALMIAGKPLPPKGNIGR